MNNHMATLPRVIQIQIAQRSEMNFFSGKSEKAKTTKEKLS